MQQRSVARFALVFIVSVAIVLAVAALPRLESRLAYGRQNVPVFTNMPETHLDQNNLVDTMTQLPLTLPISKVEWDDSILAVDLKYASAGVNPDVIYENMAEMIRFSFTQTSNVKQLLLRFVITDERTKAKRLLLAVDARRSEIDSDVLEALRHFRGESGVVTQKLHFTYTSHWQRQFSSD